jgi:nitrite reductase/ring-hydroxylating ferredoxin subunit
VDRWFAVARSAEVGGRQVVQTQLLGQEIALWRDDAGNVNAWANRCPHRGVRLSIGHNTGTELRCRYHGWRFASGTGRCTYIPAHPTQKPASTLHADVYFAIERYQYVWVSLRSQPAPPILTATPRSPGAPLSPGPTLLGMDPADSATTLRSIFVNAPARAIADALRRGYRIDAVTSASVTAQDAFTLIAIPAASPGADERGAEGTAGRGSVERGSAGPASAASTVGERRVERATFLLQPVSEAHTVIHALVSPEAGAADRLAVLRHHNAQMTLLRDALEQAPAAAVGS